jgi:hypothetical protein
MPLQKIYFNDVYHKKLGKRLEAEARIAEYYERKKLYKKGAVYGILPSVPTSL